MLNSNMTQNHRYNMTLAKKKATEEATDSLKTREMWTKCVLCGLQCIEMHTVITNQNVVTKHKRVQLTKHR